MAKRRRQGERPRPAPPSPGSAKPATGNVKTTSGNLITSVGGAGLTAACVLLLVIAGAAVYANSIHGAFVFDDQSNIVREDVIRRLWPVWPLLRTRRPLVDLTLAVNYAISGLETWSYHLFNIAVHVVAGMVLFGVLRRTLRRIAHALQREIETTGWAAIVAILWLIHPLQTQCVTYVVQRGESMMGLFYLLTLYCFIRGLDSRRVARWHVGAVLCCAAGMACKGVMVTAPFLVLLYDRAFASGSLVEALRRRAPLYAGLVATWLVLVAVGVAPGVLNPHHAGPATVGFAYKGTSPVAYLATQPGVILHYLRLVVVPVGFCLDYGWPVASKATDVILPAAVIGCMLIATVWAAWRRHPLGFAGAWFFGILAPTSSFIPIKDAAFEHRMYLSLAGIVVVVTAFAVRLGGRAMDRLGGGRRTRTVLAASCAVVASVLLGYGTIQRNNDYASEITMWRDVVAKRPDNARAQNNLGDCLVTAGRIAEGLPYLAEAVRLQPRYFRAWYNYGSAYLLLRENEKAIAAFETALDIDSDPHEAKFFTNYGVALERLGRDADAVAQFRKAIAVDPHFSKAHYNLANRLRKAGEFDEAITAYEAAIREQPDMTEAHINLGLTLRRANRLDEAIEQYNIALEQAVRNKDAALEAKVHLNLGVLYSTAGNLDSAIREYEETLRISPDDADIQQHLKELKNRKASGGRAG